MIKGTLSEEEIQAGKRLGNRRYKESRKQGLKQSIKNYSVEIDYLGAWGEIAVAKALGIEFIPTVNTFKAADIGVNLQVRTTDWPNGHLLVKDRDNDDHIYILCRCPRFPKFEIVGWCFGREAKNPDWLTDFGAYSVPNNKLRSIETLNSTPEYQQNLIGVQV
jgi:hypothetical protein